MPDLVFLFDFLSPITHLYMYTKLHLFVVLFMLLIYSFPSPSGLFLVWMSQLKHTDVRKTINKEFEQTELDINLGHEIFHI